MSFVSSWFLALCRVARHGVFCKSMVKAVWLILLLQLGILSRAFSLGGTFNPCLIRWGGRLGRGGDICSVFVILLHVGGARALGHCGHRWCFVRARPPKRAIVA